MHGLRARATRPARTAPLAALAASALLALQGCAGLASRDASAGDDLGPVAQNLVYTLVQLPESNPLTTTVQVSEPATAFGREVVALIREAGYGIQSVPDDRGGHYLRYRVQNTASELGTETRYAVSIGAVSVERAYADEGGRLVPAGAQRVRGSSSGRVAINDDVFEGVDPGVSLVVFDDDAAPTLTDASGVRTVVAPTSSVAVPSDESFGARVKRNLYDGLSSNYADLFAAYDDVSAVRIAFPNDSMRLGAEQKRVIEEYASRLQPDTDLLSVIGCSHGNTAIQNGNSVLALGRANRVKEALVYAGVPPAVVLDEGCWAGSAHEFMPERGVVLTLKRRAG